MQGLGRNTTFTRGNKFFELSNHLGNVLVTVNDKKLQHSSDDTTIDYYNADIVTANDYYPGGMIMPGRNYQASPISKYRYSINGQEKSDELNENLTTALYWEYDSRIGRRWNRDPILKVWESPYSCFSGDPILLSDILGNTGTDWVGKKNHDGTYTPVWDETVNSPKGVKVGDFLKNGDVYLGKDNIIPATDGNSYHLRPDHKADKVDPNGKVIKKDALKSPSNNPSNTKPTPPSPDDKKKDDDNSSESPQKGIIPFPIAGERPDYISVTGTAPASALSDLVKIPLPPTIGGSGTVVNDRYGNLYFSPGIGFGTQGASANLMVNYMLKPTNEKELKSFLTGVCFSASGGYYVGATVTTNKSFNIWSIGFGASTPSAGISATYTPPSWISNKGFKW